MTKEPAEPEAREGGRMLLVLEVLFVLVTVAGLALWSVAVALVVAGVLGVLACERAAADRRGARERRGGDTVGGEPQ